MTKANKAGPESSAEFSFTTTEVCTEHFGQVWPRLPQYSHDAHVPTLTRSIWYPLKGENCTLAGSLQPSRNVFVLLLNGSTLELKPVSFSAIGMREVKTGTDRKRASQEPEAIPNAKRAKNTEAPTMSATESYSEQQQALSTKHQQPSTGSSISFALSKPGSSAMPKLAASSTFPSSSASKQSLTAPSTVAPLQHSKHLAAIDEPDSDGSDSSD